MITGNGHDSIPNIFSRDNFLEVLTITNLRTYSKSVRRFVIVSSYFEENKKLKCLFAIIICLSLLSCQKSNIPQTVDDSSKTVLIKNGIVAMYNDKTFRIPIPDLEVQQYEVTNAAFKKFTDATGYITTAEKINEAMVFDSKEKKWVLKKGANWKHPQGEGTTIDKKEFHPVVQVSYEDACAYCDWIGMRLPYESEWEYIFANDAIKPATASNHWQGIFPIEDKGEDGFQGTSPVGNFGPGGAGCCDLQGNVWEWCNDYYHDLWPMIGPNYPDSIKYIGPQKSFSENNIYDTLRVVKGGSFLCADNYCKGYTNTIRISADPQLGYEHIGFRCVRRKE